MPSFIAKRIKKKLYLRIPASERERSETRPIVQSKSRHCCSLTQRRQTKYVGKCMGVPTDLHQT
jgi:hypothetical protein